MIDYEAEKRSLRERATSAEVKLARLRAAVLRLLGVSRPQHADWRDVERVLEETKP